MANFLTGPQDIAAWVRASSSDAEAATKLLNLVDSTEHEQDIWESCRRIKEGTDVEGAAGVLSKILSAYEITEERVAEVEAAWKQVYAANELHRNGRITTAQRDGMVKKAQVMRQPGQYNAMPLKICPKLPKQSAGKGVISTYDCRHYCLDSIVFDEDPLKVYCAEAMWRRHVMDKFSQEWKDEKTGKWVGGYINQRFHVMPDGGTPETKDTPRDHGNTMQLKPGERTRQPRPHQYSIERRMQEAREKGSTESIVLAQAPRDKMVKLASADVASIDTEDSVYKAYSMSVELASKNVPDAVACNTISKKCGLPLGQAVQVRSMALRKLARHRADVYITSSNANGTPVTGLKKNITREAQSEEKIQISTIKGNLGRLLEPGPWGKSLFQLVKKKNNWPSGVSTPEKISVYLEHLILDMLQRAEDFILKVEAQATDGYLVTEQVEGLKELILKIRTPKVLKNISRAATKGFCDELLSSSSSYSGLSGGQNRVTGPIDFEEMSPEAVTQKRNQLMDEYNRGTLDEESFKAQMEEFASRILRITREAQTTTASPSIQDSAIETGLCEETKPKVMKDEEKPSVQKNQKSQKPQGGIMGLVDKVKPRQQAQHDPEQKEWSDFSVGQLFRDDD